MTLLPHAGETRNSRNLSAVKTETVSVIAQEPKLSRGGSVIKRRRPNWSTSLCNVAAELAGLGREVRHG